MANLKFLDVMLLEGSDVIVDLCRYHFDQSPFPSSWHPRAFAPKCMPSPRAFAQQKMPGSRADIPGAGHLYQLAFKHENCHHSHLGLKIKLSAEVTDKVQKTQNAISNCLFALLSPMTKGLLTDLGLSIPPKFFFENFIDNCV